MAYLYRHIRLDKNEVFYVGIGKIPKHGRAFEKNKRNIYWNNIVETTNYKVEIILDNITWEEACLKEIEFINIYGRKDLKTGTLVNLTAGGDGVTGMIITDEYRQKMSVAMKGKLAGEKNPYYGKKGILSPFFRQKRPTVTGINSPNYGKKFPLISLKVIDTKTNIEYSSIKEASVCLDIKYPTLKNYLNGHRTNKTSLVYLKDFKYTK